MTSPLYLSCEEKVIMRAKISKAAIIGEWLSAPCLLITFILITVIPVSAQIFGNTQIKNQICEILGVESPDFSDMWREGVRLIALGIPSFIYGLTIFLICVLVTVWLVICLISTRRHLRYSLTLTDKRIIGKDRNAEIIAEWKDVMDLYVSQSIWGKLCKFGTVTLYTSVGAVTVRTVCDPFAIRRLCYEKIGAKSF
ncbi:MAG: hypothetical protein ACI4QN_05770 [Candidatus Coproplasma sp.]